MTGIGLRAIDNQFIIGLGTLGSRSSTSVRPGSNSGGEAARITLGLRTGAQLYVKAIEGINQVGATLNLSKSTLEELAELTDKMIALADKSTKHATSDAARGKLNRDFRNISNQFRKIVEDAKLAEDQEYLTREGLEELFVNIGLDKKSSKSIASLFSDFVITKEDTLLASEKSLGTKALKLPAAVDAAVPTPAFQLGKISSNEGGARVGGVSYTNAFISANASVYQDDDDEVGQNPGSYTSILAMGEDGSLQSLPAPITANLQVLGHSEVSGYSIVTSTQDLFGLNPGNFRQIFLTDSAGRVFSQLTNFTANYDIGSADVSSDGRVATFVTNGDPLGTNADGSLELFALEVNDFADPANILQVTDYGATAQVREFAVTEAGDRIAFRLASSGSGDDGIHIFRVGNGTNSAAQISDPTNTKFIGWTAEDEFAVFKGASEEISIIDINSNVLSTTSLQPGADKIVASENGYLAYTDYSEIFLRHYSGSEESIYTLDPADDVRTLSISRNNYGTKADVGIVGQMVSYGPESQLEFYRLREQIQATNAVLKQPDQVLKIFDGTIADRSNAFRTQNNLKALKDQIEKNIKQVDEALSILQAHADLARAAGLAMLEARDSIDSAEDAENAARLVQKLIRSKADSNALAQQENLSALATAALVSLQEDE